MIFFYLEKVIFNKIAFLKLFFRVIGKRMKSPQLEPGWQQVLSEEWDKPYIEKLAAFLKQERKENEVYPKAEDVFSAFHCTPFDQVKVVIVGQDPYHGPKQAHGLAFSVPEGIRPPPSLVNIYKELQHDLGIMPPKHGSLKKWAKQGVLLLNTVLTVRQNSPGSHANIGWEQFTDRCLEIIASEKKGVIFVLWGEFAKKKCQTILKNYQKEHLFFLAAHPSPFSAYRGFFGSSPFSKINEELKKQNKQPIDWSL